MAAQSGILPSDGLRSSWSSALQPDSTVQLMKVTIENEQLVPALELNALDGNAGGSEDEPSFESQWSLFEEQGVVERDTAAYYLMRDTSQSGQQGSWILISYVPDTAPVRSKMLYASTRSSLARSLGSGSSLFSQSLFATSPSDLTYASYKSHLAHSSAAPPLTAREEELASIRLAEASEGAEERSSERRSMLVGAGGGGQGASVGLEWSAEAEQAVRELGEKGEGAVVQLEIEKEQVVLSPSQSSGLSLPEGTPCYTFYAHARGFVFIYSCPSNSPIKSRLIYSSSSAGIVSHARTLSVDVLKKLETSDPSEITTEFIDSELPPATAATTESTPGSGASTPLPSATGDKPSFARPARPGRKR